MQPDSIVHLTVRRSMSPCDQRDGVGTRLTGATPQVNCRSMADGNLPRNTQGDATIGKFIAWTATSRWRTLVLVGASLAATGAIDYATGYRFAFAPLYLFPVVIASTALGRKAGLAVSLTAAIVWTFAQQDPRTSSPFWGQFAWNVAMRFATLGVVAWLITALETEMLSARQDYLTRLFNRRRFLQSLEAERSRSARTGAPFSVLTIDLDNFKMLNDTRGHAVGDEALRVVAALLTKSARAMDLSARMGGTNSVCCSPARMPESGSRSPGDWSPPQPRSSAGAAGRSA
jgi:GGDEF domain-containing protein